MSMLARYASLAAPAGLQYVGGNTQTLLVSANPGSISLTALTGGISSSAAEGDLVIVYYGAGYSAGTSNPGVASSGYTQVALLSAADGVNTQLYVGYKRMGATPDTTVSLNPPALSGSTISGAVVVHVWRGVESVLPFSTATTTATGINSVLCNPPSITPVTTGAVIVSGGAGGHNINTSIAYTYSSSDLSNFVTVGSAPGGAIRQATVGVGSKAWTSGAFDPAAFTFSGADAIAYSWAAVTLALLPTQNQPGPFAIAQASQQNTGNSFTLVINKPTGTREGDLMVAFMNTNDIGTWTGDTGWTEVADQGATPSTRIAYKVAGASEGASYTFTSNKLASHSGTIATYRNAVYDAVGAIATGASPLVLGSVTASAALSRILSTVARAAPNITITGPATMETIAIDNDAAAGPSRLVEQDAALSAAGASGTRSFTVGSTASVSGALVAIKPAASYTKYGQYQAVTTATSATGSATINRTACVPGNLLLLFVAAAENTAVNVTVNTVGTFTRLNFRSGVSGPFPNDPALYVFYRWADGTENTTYNITTNTTCAVAAQMVTLTGVSAGALISGSIDEGGATASVTATAVDATANGVLLFCGAQARDASAGSPTTWDPPSGMGGLGDVGISTASTALGFFVAYQEALSAGSTGNKTATAFVTSGNSRYRAVLVTVGAK